MSCSSDESKPLRGAVVGYGFISSQGHIPAYLERMRQQKDIQLVAVADICEPRKRLAQEALKDVCSGLRTYSDPYALLEAEGRNLDFIDISTPPYEHAPLALAALRQGLHVLCEKPLATTLKDADSILKNALQNQRVIFPCHNYKHAPVVKAIREIIQSGKIGQVRSVTLNTFRNTHAKGVTEWRTHWRREKQWSGGGIAMDHGSHSFYLAFDWMGAYPTAVTAKMANLTPHLYDTEDQLSVVLTFPQGLVHAYLSWTAGVRKVIYSVQGDRGAITVDDDDLQLALFQKSDRPDVAQGSVQWEVERKSIASDWMDASHVHWFNSMFDEFIEAIRKKDFVSRDAYEAYLCIQTITAAYRSAEQGCMEISLPSSMER